jgi:hypothetical protein
MVSIVGFVTTIAGLWPWITIELSSSAGRTDPFTGRMKNK